MLRDLIIEKGESVYRVAKGSGLAYTTLNELVLGKKDPRDCSLKTAAALAKYWGMELGALYERMLSGSSGYAALEEKVNPLRRNEIFSLLNACHEDTRIKKVILFGSSIKTHGKENDDIDIAIELKDECIGDKTTVASMLLRASGNLADIVWLNSLHPDSVLSKVIAEGIVC